MTVSGILPSLRRSGRALKKQKQKIIYVSYNHRLLRNLVTIFSDIFLPTADQLSTVPNARAPMLAENV